MVVWRSLDVGAASSFGRTLRGLARFRVVSRGLALNRKSLLLLLCPSYKLRSGILLPGFPDLPCEEGLLA